LPRKSISVHHHHYHHHHHDNYFNIRLPAITAFSRYYGTYNHNSSNVSVSIIVIVISIIRIIILVVVHLSILRVSSSCSTPTFSQQASDDPRQASTKEGRKGCHLPKATVRRQAFVSTTTTTTTNRQEIRQEASRRHSKTSTLGPIVGRICAVIGRHCR
jgi:hypothetical protein